MLVLLVSEGGGGITNIGNHNYIISKQAKYFAEVGIRKVGLL